MSAPQPPALFPIFRSHQQAQMLAVLFLGPNIDYSTSALAQEAGITHQAVSRLMPPLITAGIVNTRLVGRRSLYSANTQAPTYSPLRTLLALTYGPVPVLLRELDGLPGLEAVLIFGSWAKRALGTPGKFPNDLDVLVIGDIDRTALHDALDRVEQTVAREVNPIQISKDEWDNPTRGLIRSIKTQGQYLTVLTNEGVV